MARVPSGRQTKQSSSGGEGRVALACDSCRRRKSKCDGIQPRCGSCRTLQIQCSYVSARTPKRQKYWDKEYVRTLEDQVKTLTAMVESQQWGANVEPPVGAKAASEGLKPQIAQDDHSYTSKAKEALRSFASLNWRPSSFSGRMAKGFFAGPGRFSIMPKTVLPTFEDIKTESSSPPNISPVSSSSSFAAAMSPQFALKRQLKQHFLESINVYIRFVDPSWLEFSDLFPNNDTPLQLLYGAVFAAAAQSMESVPKDTAAGFMAYAESLVQQCYLEHLCLPVLQALIIMAWLKHSMLETTKANIYQYMAVGLSTHLEVQEATHQGGNAEELVTISTFWSLYFVDRMATAKLGCPPGIPWDIGQVLSYTSVMAPETVNIEHLAFDYHCRLFYLQQEHIEPLYAANAKTLPAAEKQTICAKANNALIQFRKQIDSRLYISRNQKPDKTQIVFWISYHAVIVSLNRPMLDPDGTNDGAQRVSVCLRAASGAADAIARLVKLLTSTGEAHTVPPFAIYNVLRAGLVHGLCMVVAMEEEEERGGAGKQHKSSKFWLCAQLLMEAAKSWPELAGPLFEFLTSTCRSWGLDLDETPPKHILSDVLEGGFDETEGIYGEM